MNTATQHNDVQYNKHSAAVTEDMFQPPPVN